MLRKSAVRVSNFSDPVCYCVLPLDPSQLSLRFFLSVCLLVRFLNALDRRNICVMAIYVF